MWNCAYIFRWVFVWGLFLFLPSVVLSQYAYNIGTSGKWLYGDSFDSAMKSAGYPSRPTYYQPNASFGFHCFLNRFYGEDGYYPDGWKHADSKGGYLIPLSGNSFIEISNPSTWNGVYSTAMSVGKCGFCAGISGSTGWTSISIKYYGLPVGNRVIPSWVYDSPYIRDLEFITDDPGVNGSTIIGATFDVVPPVGQTLDDGYFNEYDFDNAPVWTSYDDPEIPESGGYTNPVSSAWTSDKVALQLQHSSSIRGSVDSIKNSSSSINSHFVNLGDNITAYVQTQNNNWNWLKNQNFSPTVNVPPPQITVQSPVVNVSPPQVTVLPPDVNVSLEGSDNSDLLQHLEGIKGALDSNLSESDFPSVQNPEQSQVDHDAQYESELNEKVEAWSGIYDSFDNFISSVSSGLSGLMGSFVGSWAGVGRERPAMTINFALSILDYSFTVDLSPYESAISFFRSFSAVMLIVGFLFLIYKLFLGVGD